VVAPNAPASGSPRPSLWRDLRDGFDYVRADPLASAVIIISVVMNVLLFQYQGMLSVFAENVLHVGPVELGTLGAATGVGAAVSVFIQPLFRSTRAQGLAFIVGSIVGAASLALFSFTTGYAAALTLLFIVGVGTSSFGTMQSSLILSRSSPTMRGRAMGLVTLAIGSAPLGSLQLGYLADTVGVQVAIGLNSALCLVLVTVIGMRYGVFGRNLKDPPHRPSPPVPLSPQRGGDGATSPLPKEEGQRVGVGSNSPLPKEEGQGVGVATSRPPPV
jgi:MFS family permease